MRALERIRKKATLLTIEGENIKNEQFEECYYNKGLFSVRTGKYTYYCTEDQDYYCDGKYALVIHLGKVEEARAELISEKIESLNRIINQQEESIGKKRKRISQLKKLI